VRSDLPDPRKSAKSGLTRLDYRAWSGLPRFLLPDVADLVRSSIALRFASLDLVLTEGAYQARRPEESLLHQVVAGELETFLASQQDNERQVPGFIEREFRSFLDCGVLARGFLRIACDTCRLDRVVAFSCKSRGICPSCGGRRMADTAAHLVDRVIPDVPVRQWVLSPPHALRYRLAYDPRLLAVLIRIFIRAVFSSLRRRARANGISRGQCGAVAFLQRFGSSLNLHPHVHVLVLDGVFAGLEGETPRFYPLRAPDDPDVADVAETVSRRTQALWRKRGIGASDDGETEDPLMRNTPWLAGLYAHGVRGRIAQGAEHRETQPNLGWQWRIPRAGTIRAALRQCRWVQRSCECELAGPSASKAGESLPLYVEASTGCRAFGAS